MRITVFGASGKVGSLVVEEALNRGYDVTAFVHNHSLFAPSGKLAIIKGDIYKEADIRTALQGSSAVISCLGSWGTPKKDVLTAAMRTIIPAMTEQKIMRVITLTGSGAYAPDDRIGIAHKLIFFVTAPFPASKVFHDGEEHMRLLAASGLDWTTIRSPVMNNLGKTTYKLNLKSGSPLATINRHAVAVALVDQLVLKDHSAQAPIIHRSAVSSISQLPKL